MEMMRPEFAPGLKPKNKKKDNVDEDKKFHKSVALASQTPPNRDPIQEKEMRIEDPEDFLRLMYERALLMKEKNGLLVESKIMNPEVMGDRAIVIKEILDDLNKFQRVFGKEVTDYVTPEIAAYLKLSISQGDPEYLLHVIEAIRGQGQENDFPKSELK